jgi:hypothetical protein
MIGSVAVDTGTVLVLAAIALAEGITRIPAGALVLRRMLVGPWQVSGPSAPRNLMRLVHWWPPMTDTLVVSPISTTPLTRVALQERLRATAPVRRAARATGALTLLGLVLGIPLGVGFAGWFGGLLAAGGVLAGQVVLGALGWRGLHLLGETRRARARLLAVTLNPFAAPHTASRLLAAATAGATPLTVAHALLTPDRWTAWFRPRAYDAGVALAPDQELARGLEAVPHAIDQVLSQRPPMASDDRWCPRCAATYQPGFTACAECEVPLLAASETVAPRQRHASD